MGKASKTARRNMVRGKTSVIVTVLDERETIKELVGALAGQTVRPVEIIIVDGGSTDGTWEILQKDKRLKAYRIPGNRSVGRNFAISKAKSRIIAITDAGCIPDQNWLEELINPFSPPSPRLGEGTGVRYRQVDVVSGYYRGQPKNIFQKCLIPYVLVMPDKASKTKFFPSTRSMAMRKSVWEMYKFDENLWHNEDYAYAHTLKRAGFNFTFAPQAIVSWLPRQNLKQAAWMFMRFAIGDIQAGILRPQVKNLFIRYLVFGYLFFLSLEFHILFYPLMFSALSYLLFAVVKNYRYVRDPRAMFWLPVLQITADLMVISGTVMGFMSKWI